MPSSHFLAQDQQFSFEALVKNSALPSFTSDLAIKRYGKDANRVLVPILDPEANVSYYFMVCQAPKRQWELLLMRLKDKCSDNKILYTPLYQVSTSL